MDILLICLGLVLMLAGLLGSILPVLPGIPLSWLGILLLHLAPSIPFNWWLVCSTFVIAVIIYVLAYILPSVGTKKFGGSKAGAWGAIIGLFTGIFLPIPLGFLIGPFAGALAGELLVTKTTGKVALKAAFGSFIGFVASSLMELIATTAYFGIFMYVVWNYKFLLF